MRDENTLLRQLREATPSRQYRGLPMSRSELAALVVKHVWDHHRVVCAVDRKYIARLETGKIRWPNQRYRHALRDIFGVGDDAALGFVPGNLQRAATLLNDEPPLLVDPTSPWTPEGVIAEITALSEVDAMDTDRRNLLRLAAGAPLALIALDAFAAPVAASVARSAGQKITHSDVDAIERMLDDWRHQDDNCGGRVVLTFTQAQLRAVGGLLRTSSYADAVGRRLHAVAAELLRFLGWLHWDSLNYNAAQRHWVLALKAARLAGDDQIRANILAFMSCQLTELGYSNDAVRVGTAARLSVTDSPRVATIAHLLYSNAVAAHDEHEARRAIDAAVSTYQRGGPGPTFAYWMDSAHVDEHIGRSHLAFGDVDGAIEHLGRFASTVTGDRERARANAFLARAWAAADEPDQACHAGFVALDLLNGDVVSPRCIAQLGSVANDLSRFETPEVAEFNNRLSQLTAA